MRYMTNFLRFFGDACAFFEGPLIFAVIAIKSFRYGQHFDETVYIVDTSRKLLRDLDEDYVDNCKKKKKKTSWGMWIIFQRSATINNCLPPQWQKKKIKSKKLTSAICQIELTWLVQVIFINVLECKRYHYSTFCIIDIFCNRYFFLLHNIKQRLIVRHIFRYEVICSIQFPPMNVPCAFTDNNMAILFLICCVCHAESAM